MVYLVLRGDDCIIYHILECYKSNLTDNELEEILSIVLIVGGSIVVPHLRRALQTWDDFKKSNMKNQKKI